MNKKIVKSKFVVTMERINEGMCTGKDLINIVKFQCRMFGEIPNEVAAELVVRQVIYN